MKKLLRNIVLGLLGTSLGLSLIASPSAVYAATAQPKSSFAVEKSAKTAAKNEQKATVNKTAQNPVEVVKASAGKLGFNAKKDSFTLVSQSATQATVSVNHEKSIYNVILQLNKDKTQWNVVSVKKSATAKQNSSTNGNTGTNSGNSTGTTGTTTTSSADVSAAEQKAVELLNADRKANGLSALTASSALTAVARSHAQDMVDRGFFSHTNPDGKTLADRLKAAGISYSAAGENIAQNQSVEAAETSLMNSSGHRANILNTTYTTVGIGVAYDSQGNVYVVQNFIK